MTRNVDVQVSGNKATFDSLFFSHDGQGYGDTDEILVEDGTIAQFNWGERFDMACDA